MPDPYVVREAVSEDARGIARVHVDAWHETYRGLLPDGLIDRITYAEREQQAEQWLVRDTWRTFVAVGPSGIVGFASGGPNRDPADPAFAAYPGELYAIYMLAAHQKRGLGRALFERVRTTLRERGLAPFLLWVLDRNPACAFYERLEGRKIVTQPAQLRDVSIVEHGYAWD